MKHILSVWKLLPQKGGRVLMNCIIRSLCVSLCALSISLLSRAAVNAVADAGGPVFTRELGMWIGITVALFALFALFDYGLKRSCISAQNYLKSHILNCLLGQKYSVAEGKTESFLAVLGRDSFEYIQMLQQSLPELMTTTLTALIMIGAAFGMSPAAALIALGCCLLFSASLLLIKRIQALEGEAREVQEEITGLLLQIHKGLPIFHLFVGSRRFLSRYQKAITRLWGLDRKKALITALLSTLAIFTNLVREFGVIIFVVLVDGRDLGTASAMLNITSFINGFVVSVIMEVSSMSKGIVAARQIEAFCQEPWEESDNEGRGQTVESLSCQGLSFRYPNGGGVSDVSFQASRGSVLGIFGQIGSGKTTLVNMLGGLYTPASGEILRDGARVESQTQLRLLTSIMDQRSLAIPASVRDNITMFAKADEGRIWQIADMLGLRDWIEAQEEGLDTILDPDSLAMSGGQLQRLALARALYSHGGVLILDEPTASLDKAGVDELLGLLEDIKRERIVIVVTHDERIMPIFDQVVML